MSRRRKTSKHNETNDLAQALILNGQAMAEGPRRKTWTIHDLRQIKPLTNTQNDMFHDFIMGKNIIAHGSAGTGKTYIALWLALNELMRKESGVRRVIIVRSAVQTRDLGFTPGDVDEKMALYEVPYRAIFHDLFGRWSTYDDMKTAGLVEFCTTSFLRGLTWDDAIVVVDECQSMTFHELDTVMTRIGERSRIILAGDTSQNDLRKTKQDVSGMAEMLRVASRMGGFSIIKFSRHDIVRSDFVKQWITAREEEGI